MTATGLIAANSGWSVTGLALLGGAAVMVAVMTMRRLARRARG